MAKAGHTLGRSDIMTDDTWLELMPADHRLCYERGVASSRELLEAQPARFIGPLGRVWAAQYLERKTAVAFAKMRRAASRAGIELWIYSGWRSHQEQERLYREWERWHKWAMGGRSGPEPQPARRLRPASPGWSLHESGMAADLLRSHDDPDGGGPMLGITDTWLAEHAREFGFARTVAAELWHWQRVA